MMANQKALYSAPFAANLQRYAPSKRTERIKQGRTIAAIISSRPVRLVGRAYRKRLKLPARAKVHRSQPPRAPEL